MAVKATVNAITPSYAQKLIGANKIDSVSDGSTNLIKRFEVKSGVKVKMVRNKKSGSTEFYREIYH